MNYKIGITACLLIGITFLCGCTSTTEEVQPLLVYAGAGLKVPLDVNIAGFTQETGIQVIPNYGPSGGLYAQINEGQPADVFFSADWKFIENLEDDGKLTDSIKLLEDNIVLVRSKTGEEKGIEKIQDLVKPDISIAVADPGAPIGQYSENVLDSTGMTEALSQGAIKARPSTVNQVALMVEKDEVDAGFLYSSTASLYNLTPVQRFDTTQSGEIVFGIGIIKGGDEKRAKEFTDYLDKHTDEYMKYGWTRYA